MKTVQRAHIVDSGVALAKPMFTDASLSSSAPARPDTPSNLDLEAMATARTALGIGIYSREEAARLIGVTPSRLRRWVDGYTYHYRYHSVATKRNRPPVVARDLPVLDDTIALSFVELMELRIVRALRKRGVSLQEIRKAAEVAGTQFGTVHPFASRRVFSDGRRVFAALSRTADVPDLIHLSRSKVAQVIAGGILEPFVEEIDFDEETALAERWWPLGRTAPVVLDPRIAFGAPTVVGTRLRTSFLAELHSGLASDEIARTYRVPTEAVAAAVHFEKHLKAA